MKARMWQADSGMFLGEIRYDDGDISGTIAKTAFDVHKWLYEHGVKSKDLEFIQNKVSR